MSDKNIKHVLRPSVRFLRESGKLVLTTADMAEFLQVPRATVQQLVYSDRIPLPMHLGLGKILRWNVFELLQWIEADCPRRRVWIKMRGTSGWYPLLRWPNWP